jgi:hypothetical protein
VTYQCPKDINSPWAPGTFDLTLAATTESPTCLTTRTTQTAQVVVTDKPQVTVTATDTFCEDVGVRFRVQVQTDDVLFALSPPTRIDTSDGRLCTLLSSNKRECVAVGGLLAATC